MVRAIRLVTFIAPAVVGLERQVFSEPPHAADGHEAIGVTVAGVGEGAGSPLPLDSYGPGTEWRTIRNSAYATSGTDERISSL